MSGTAGFRDFQPGVRVRYTGKFLRNTGQHVGAVGQSTWIVQACSCTLCALGEHVYTDEPLHVSLWSEGMQPNRHIAKENLFIVGQRDSRNCP